ncbi:PH domain-containing protein, partial [Streptomyces niveus]|uniref:PH domain-containing protein n=1 Tax=Streptomyces niveus TaxID=193462 RepID=UPI0034409BF6
MTVPAARPALPDPPALPVTFRPNGTRAVLLSVGALMLVVITAMSVTLEKLNAGERASFIFVALLFFGVLCLLSRPKVVADDTGVIVVNLTRVRRLEWPEILRVNLRVGDPWVFLDLSDGTSLPVLGIQQVEAAFEGAPWLAGIRGMTSVPLAVPPPATLRHLPLLT